MCKNSDNDNEEDDLGNWKRQRKTERPINLVWFLYNLFFLPQIC